LKAKLHVHGPERRASFGFTLTGAFFYAMNPVAALGFRGYEARKIVESAVLGGF
jgi:hypothetical protein